jgi:hypothetical protein
MRYKVTPRTYTLLGSLRQLAAELEPYVGFACSAARDEWLSLQRLWPSEEELAGGSINLSESDLEEMEGRIRRFAAILSTLAEAHNVRPQEGRARAAARTPFETRVALPGLPVAPIERQQRGG